MKKVRHELAGRKFGRLTVLEYAYTKNGTAIWKCRCECGKVAYPSSGNLLSGNSKSCGCLHDEELKKRVTTHGETKTRLYNIWHKMIQRCCNPKEKAFENYGGRGISVCKEWRNGFEVFKEWAVANGYSDNLTIDRIDNDGDYEPKNCRWATTEVQANNKRSNRFIAYNGKTQTIKQWADELGINYYTLQSRITKRHWDIERALTKTSYAKSEG